MSGSKNRYPGRGVPPSMGTSQEESRFAACTAASDVHPINDDPVIKSDMITMTFMRKRFKEPNAGTQ